MAQLKITTVSQGLPVGPKGRQMAGQVRQLATLAGPRQVISVLPNGVWMLDDIPAPMYDEGTRRFYTSDWARGYKRDDR